MSEMEFDLAEISKNVLEMWKKRDTFNKCQEQNKDCETMNFLDGPPFVNGLPHHGHMLVSFIKDVVIRYQHMNKKYIERNFGADCHGLPLEQAAEKALGISSKTDIDKIGIKAFNGKCSEIVNNHSDIWQNTFGKIGRWVDFTKAYKTSDFKYMENEWWAFNELYKKGLIYEGFKVMPYSWACGTALSNFESNQNYQSKTDPSITLKLKVIGHDNTFFLVWTTTPWTLPANVAICVNSKYEYCFVEHEENTYIICKELVGKYFKKPKLVKTCNGIDLVDMKYEPLFNYYQNQNFFKVFQDDYVKNDGGTGIVHLAPAFGADDFRVGLKHNLFQKDGTGLICPIDDCCVYTNTEWKGQHALDCNKDIITRLKENGKIFKSESIVHQYPFCYRTDKPLIYKAVKAWFLNVEKIKDQLVENNKQINWVPKFVGEHRFGNWLENAVDWCLSRDRYWGTPIPIWRSDDGDCICVSSPSELGDLTDIHREFVDDIVIEKNGKQYRRVAGVLDCWFESGLAAVARFDVELNKNNETSAYPVDFIAESLDQTRGWFYTMNVLSTALYNKPGFKNVIVSGLILAADGKKMAKRLGNYTDPNILFDKYGADAVRLYLISSPATRAEPFSFQDKGVEEMVRKLIPYMNANKFFFECYQRYQTINSDEPWEDSNYVMDIWIKDQLKIMGQKLRDDIEMFKLDNLSSYLFKFLDNLTNCYIKLNRNRLKGLFDFENQENNSKHWKNSISTLFCVLKNVCILMAPLAPFLSEHFYQQIAKIDNSCKESVHMNYFTDIDLDSVDDTIQRKVSNCQQVIDLIRKMRDTKLTFPYGMPINNVIIAHSKEEFINDVREMEEYIITETNILNIEYRKAAEFVDFIIEPRAGTIGKQFKKDNKEVCDLIKSCTYDTIINLKFGEINITDEFYVMKPKLIIDIPDSEVDTINELVIIMSTYINKDMKDKLLLNNLRKQIQQFRKDANVQMWDKVKIGLYVPEIKDFIKNNKHSLEQTLWCELVLEKLQNSFFDKEVSLENIDMYMSIEK
jgi:isoleucyl-tRNA synthetase